MKRATTPAPTAPAQAVFYFPSKQDKNMEKISKLFCCTRRSKLYQLHVAQRQLQQPLNNLEKIDYQNLQYKKLADSILLSLFMRTYEKSNKPHAPIS